MVDLLLQSIGNKNCPVKVTGRVLKRLNLNAPSHTYSHFMQHGISIQLNGNKPWVATNNVVVTGNFGSGVAEGK